MPPLFVLGLPCFLVRLPPWWNASSPQCVHISVLSLVVLPAWHLGHTQGLIPSGYMPACCAADLGQAIATAMTVMGSDDDTSSEDEALLAPQKLVKQLRQV